MTNLSSRLQKLVTILLIANNLFIVLLILFGLISIFYSYISPVIQPGDYPIVVEDSGVIHT